MYSPFDTMERNVLMGLESCFHFYVFYLWLPANIMNAFFWWKMQVYSFKRWNVSRLYHSHVVMFVQRASDSLDLDTLLWRKEITIFCTSTSILSLSCNRPSLPQDSDFKPFYSSLCLHRKSEAEKNCKITPSRRIKHLSKGGEKCKSICTQDML